jgi:hypothetical protein
MTPTQIRLSIMTLMGVTLYQALVIRRLKKNLNRGRNQFNKLHEMTDYFLDIINENNIELTEFDIIALTAINEDK